MNMNRRLAVASILLGLAVIPACGRSDPIPDAREPGVIPTREVQPEDGAELETPGANSHVRATLAAPAGQPQPELAVGDVRLHVSNQSYDDDPVTLTIRVDNTVVVDDSFLVESQHNWIAYDITGLEPGKHKLVAKSSTGAGVADEFTLPANESRWLVVDYWYSADDAAGRHITLDESAEAVGFA